MTKANKNHTDTKQSSADSFESLIVDISNNIVTSLSEMMSQLLDTAQNQLFSMSNEADSNEDQARYFELMNQIRTLKQGIAEDFINNVNTYMSPASDAGDNEQQKNIDDDGDELSLIDQDDMEAIVLVKGIGERAAAKYQEQLLQLEARLQHLSDKTTNAFKAEAVKPTNFCQAFDDALGNNFDTANKKTLFTIFDTDIANNLGDIYDAINKSLIDAGILPRIKLGAPIKQDTSRSESTAANQSDESQNNASAENTTNEKSNANNISGFAMTAPPGENHHHTDQTDVSSEANRDTQSSESGSYYGQRSTEGSAEYKHQTAGLPASRVGHILSNYLGTPFNPATADNSSDNSAIYPQSTEQHFGHQEVLQALSGIQNLPQFDQSEDSHFNGEDLKQAIISSIAKTSGGAVTKGINQIAEKTIDFIELIFDAIIDDKEISDTIKTLLLRLQIPIIKASMSDQEFFIYDDHPARELLDNIADVGVGITEHTDDTYLFIDKIISDILNEYDLSTETFKEALDELKAYVEEKEALTRAKEKEEQQLLLRKHARATILKSLRAATTGKILPETTHPLILKRWPTLMFNHYLANGKENDEWINIVLTLRRIVDSVQPVNSADHMAKIIREKSVLFELTEKYLNISSNSKKDVQNIMAVYKETVQQLIDDANFTDQEVDAADKQIKSSDSVSEVLIDDEDTNKPEIPKNIMPGMWFQIYMGEDRSPRRCKLSVILIEDANLMFVNHKGELIVEKTFDEFNEEVANETTTVIMGHSAFENAFKSVINRLD